jgi:hypothetical protein
MKPRIYLSHSSVDRASARQLADALRRRALEVSSADSVSAPGENWAASVAKALGQSDAMVVLLTPNSVESEWVRRDIEYALSSKRFAHRLIPVVIGGEDPDWMSKVPWVLKTLKVISSPNVAQASRQVASALADAT